MWGLATTRPCVPEARYDFADRCVLKTRYPINLTLNTSNKIIRWMIFVGILATTRVCVPKARYYYYPACVSSVPPARWWWLYTDTPHSACGLCGVIEIAPLRGAVLVWGLCGTALATGRYGVMQGRTSPRCWTCVPEARYPINPTQSASAVWGLSRPNGHACRRHATTITRHV